MEEKRNSSKEFLLKALLKPSYEERAKLKSILFRDHSIPIQDVHFTIDERSEEEDKERLDEGTNDAWECLLKKQSSNKGTKQSVAVAEIFTPKKQLTQQIDIARKLISGDGVSAQPEPEKSINHVLIVGQAGSGKTTLSKYIAHQWAQGNLWAERYQQVFWITLRDLHHDRIKLNNCKDSLLLAALIHEYCFDRESRRQISPAMILQCLESQPKGTLLLLDGYDEIAEVFSNNTKKNQRLRKLLYILFNTSSDLILTSRSYSIPPSEKINFERRLTNEGFSDIQVQDYIQRYFVHLPIPDERLADEVQRLTKQNLRLWSHAHTPLILTLICDFYRNAKETGKHNLGNLTLIDLYNEALKVFLRRYLDRQGKLLSDQKLSWEKTSEWTLDDFLTHCFLEVEFLEAIAFHGVEKGTQRFDKKLKEEVLKKVVERYRKEIMLSESIGTILLQD
jgi:predicted NACHT family NTPase